MHFSVIFRITGMLLMVFSFTMLIPIPVALIYGEATLLAFFYGFLITLVGGAALALPVRSPRELRARDGFPITVLFYVALGGFGALPLYLSVGEFGNFTDALFESLSGLTTTGATVLTNIDSIPKSVLFYRQQLQWLGGMGIIVLAVAILPMLGVGGMQLYRAETPGPVKDSKLTPRITETAKALWYIYLTLTISCAGAYWLAGMSAFDAICHAFSTIAIGGFSTHDASMGYFDNPWIESVAIIFMIISAINFGLHFVAWRRRSLIGYFSDPEVVFFLTLLFSATALITTVLLSFDYTGFSSLRFAIFQVVSMATTTGFATDNFSIWPAFAPFLLVFLAIIGGCAGSTAGGLKVARVLLIYLQGLREMKRLVHPNAVVVVKLGTNPVPDRVLESVWGFFSVYMLAFTVMVFLLLATELDFLTSFSAIAATINNLGPGLGAVAAHYGDITDPAKWVLIFAMLLGRLEIFTLLVLFTPTFWRR